MLDSLNATYSVLHSWMIGTILEVLFAHRVANRKPLEMRGLLSCCIWLFDTPRIIGSHHNLVNEIALYFYKITFSVRIINRRQRLKEELLSVETLALMSAPDSQPGPLPCMLRNNKKRNLLGNALNQYHRLKP